MSITITINFTDDRVGANAAARALGHILAVGYQDGGITNVDTMVTPPTSQLVDEDRELHTLAGVEPDDLDTFIDQSSPEFQEALRKVQQQQELDELNKLLDVQEAAIRAAAVRPPSNKSTKRANAPAPGYKTTDARPRSNDVKYGSWMSDDEIRSVQCPHCYALKGEPCHNNHNAPTRYYHRGRIANADQGLDSKPAHYSSNML